MNYHERHEKQVVNAQLICFLVAGIFSFTADLFSGAAQQIIYKFVDSIIITGTLLVAMKLAREGWDMPAAGYTLVSIAWGSLFLAKDFQQLSVGEDILASSFYFLLPAMILIIFYQPFPWWIKIVCIATIVPSLIGLIESKTGTASVDPVWKKINYQAVHITSLFWGFFFLLQHKKMKTIKEVKPN